MALDGDPLVLAGFLDVARGGASGFIRLLFRRHTLLRIRFDPAVAHVRLRGRRGLTVDDGDDGVDGQIQIARTAACATLEFHGCISAVGLLGFGAIPFLELLWRLRGKVGNTTHERRGTKKKWVC